MKTMVRRWVLVAAALCAVVASGCSKDSGGGGGAGAASAKGALGMMPKDSDAVVGIDFAALRSSELYKKYSPLLMKAAGDKLAEFKTACGFDPIESAGTATIGVKGDKSNQDVTIIVTGFKKDQVVECAKKMAEKEGKGTQVKVDGDYVEFTTSDGPGGVLFVGDAILAHVVGKKSASKDELIAQSKQANDASLAGSKDFMDMLGKVDTKGGVWFVANGKAPSMQNSPFKAQFVFGSVKVSDGIAADLNMKMETEADAKQVGDMAKSQFDQVKSAGMIDDGSADVSGKDVHIKVSMKQQQIEMIASMAKGMMGGMHGGGGGGDSGSP